MDRRTFLAGMLAAPAVVSAGNIWIPPRRVIAPPAFTYTQAGTYSIRVVLHDHMESDEVIELTARPYVVFRQA